MVGLIYPQQGTTCTPSQSVLLPLPQTTYTVERIFARLLKEPFALKCPGFYDCLPYEKIILLATFNQNLTMK
jgi:hypothetical protein